MTPENNFSKENGLTGKIIEIKKYSKEAIAKVINMAAPLIKKEEGVQKYGKAGKVFQMMTYPASFVKNFKDEDTEKRA